MYCMTNKTIQCIHLYSIVSTIREVVIYEKKNDVSCMLMLLLMTQTVFALPYTEKSDEQLIAENMVILENELTENHTDVVSELNKMIVQYEAMAAAATQEEAEQMRNLIATLEELIVDYQLYNAGISTYKFHALYSPAVAAVIAYFNAKNYMLAAELLTHAKENTDRVSIYVPAYSARAKYTAVIQQIGYGTVVEGKVSFEPGDSEIDMDMYYAVHDFDFFKETPTSRLVYVCDTYDFGDDDANYTSIAGIAVETMYRAQEAGFLTPYIVLFSVPV